MKWLAAFAASAGVVFITAMVLVLLFGVRDPFHGNILISILMYGIAIGTFGAVLHRLQQGTKEQRVGPSSSATSPPCDDTISQNNRSAGEANHVGNVSSLQSGSTDLPPTKGVRSEPRSATTLIADRVAYAEALRQSEGEGRDDGIWAMALARSGGDLGKAKAAYIEIAARDIVFRELRKRAASCIESMNAADLQNTIAEMQRRNAGDLDEELQQYGVQLDCMLRVKAARMQLEASKRKASQQAMPALDQIKLPKPVKGRDGCSPSLNSAIAEVNDEIDALRQRVVSKNAEQAGVLLQEAVSHMNKKRYPRARQKTFAASKLVGLKQQIILPNGVTYTCDQLSNEIETREGNVGCLIATIILAVVVLALLLSCLERLT